jgi:hypothetical protein
MATKRFGEAGMDEPPPPFERREVAPYWFRDAPAHEVTGNHVGDKDDVDDDRLTTVIMSACGRIDAYAEDRPEPSREVLRLSRAFRHPSHSVEHLAVVTSPAGATLGPLEQVAEAVSPALGEGGSSVRHRRSEGGSTGDPIRQIESS